MKGLEGMSYSKEAKSLALSIGEKRKLSCAPLGLYRFLRRGSERQVLICSLALSDRTDGTGSKQCQGR